LNETIRSTSARLSGLLHFRGKLLHEHLYELRLRRGSTPICQYRSGIRPTFTIVRITGLAVATLAAKDAGSGSAIFNIFRNIGGSVGIAILSTLVTRREQFHDLRIGELVTVYAPATQARLAEVQWNFMSKGLDATMS